MIAEYKIVSSSDLSGLEKMVERSIKMGWIPQGGVACSSGEYMYKYLQAMIKGG